MRSSYVEIEIDDNIVISGEVSKRDTSYDDAYGTIKDLEHVVSNLIVVVWIDGIDYEVQDSLNAAGKERFKDKLIAKYEKDRS